MSAVKTCQRAVGLPCGASAGGLHRKRENSRFSLDSWWAGFRTFYAALSVFLEKHRVLFDGYVRLQRRLGYKRKIPKGLVPHMGSQWWCLTRQTLSAILEDPDRDIYDRYFKRVWIPDESYFQTMARQYSLKIESRSLTLSKFDYQGKPHIF